MRGGPRRTGQGTRESVDGTAAQGQGARSIQVSKIIEDGAKGSDVKMNIGEVGKDIDEVAGRPTDGRGRMLGWTGTGAGRLESGGESVDPAASITVRGFGARVEDAGARAEDDARLVDAGAMSQAVDGCSGEAARSGGYHRLGTPVGASQHSGVDRIALVAVRSTTTGLGHVVRSADLLTPPAQWVTMCGWHFGCRPHMACSLTDVNCRARLGACWSARGQVGVELARPAPGSGR